MRAFLSFVPLRGCFHMLHLLTQCSDMLHQAMQKTWKHDADSAAYTMANKQNTQEETKTKIEEGNTNTNGDDFEKTPQKRGVQCEKYEEREWKTEQDETRHDFSCGRNLKQDTIWNTVLAKIILECKSRRKLSLCERPRH